MPLTVTIITPEKAYPPIVADQVTLPAFDGQVGILPRHAAYVCLLGSGELKLSNASRAEERFAVQGGVAQVSADQVRILAEKVAPVSAITEADLLKKLQALDDAEYDSDLAKTEAQSRAHWIAVQLKAKGKDVPPLKKL